jgi:4-hydroxy-tetrahydrodipicolinate synthase
MSKRARRVGSAGVWSAAPTPFTDKMQVDKVAVRRMVDHHVRLGVKGLFLAGSNGEGPWMTTRQRADLLGAAMGHNKGRLRVAFQVTDNSAGKVLENMELALRGGADVAVIAAPWFTRNATPANLLKHYAEAIRHSPLPVGIYDLGRRAPVFVPNAVMREVLSHRKVVMIKDSSRDPVRMKLALAARRRRPALSVLTGSEFDCVDYLEAGYDGLLLGGGVFNGHLAGMIVDATASGDMALAAKLQRRMNRIMWAVYGGKTIRCWLAGEKELLVGLGVFRTHKNLLGYELTPATRRAIRKVLERDRDVLMP